MQSYPSILYDDSNHMLSGIKLFIETNRNKILVRILSLNSYFRWSREGSALMH